MSIKIIEAVDVFLESRVLNTNRTFRAAWGRWVNYRTAFGLATASPLDCHKFVLAFSKSHSDNSTHTLVSSLRSIYNYLIAVNKIKINPWSGAKYYYNQRQRVQVRPTATLTKGQVRNILESQAEARCPNEVRDRALIYLLFGAGLRREEARGLNVGDVFLTQGELAIDAISYLESSDRDPDINEVLVVRLSKTKSGVNVVQPVAQWAAVRLSDLVCQRKLEGAEDKDPLFVNHSRKRKKRISESTLYRIFKNSVGKLSIKAAPHSARASFATRLLEQGISKDLVGEALRHKDGRSVHIYDKRLRQIKDNASLLIKK